MREYKKLDGNVSKKIMKRRIMKNRIVFGKGNLMPVFRISEDEVMMVIAKNNHHYPLGEIIPASVGEVLVKEANSLVMLSFPKDENGIKSIESLEQWLSIVKEHIETGTNLLD